jgi:hypothetical protein
MACGDQRQPEVTLIKMTIIIHEESNIPEHVELHTACERENLTISKMFNTKVLFQQRMETHLNGGIWVMFMTAVLNRKKKEASL